MALLRYMKVSACLITEHLHQTLQGVLVGRRINPVDVPRAAEPEGQGWLWTKPVSNEANDTAWNVSLEIHCRITRPGRWRYRQQTKFDVKRELTALWFGISSVATDSVPSKSIPEGPAIAVTARIPTISRRVPSLGGSLLSISITGHVQAQKGRSD
jgi:hypothetical protein